MSGFGGSEGGSWDSKAPWGLSCRVQVGGGAWDSRATCRLSCRVQIGGGWRRWEGGGHGILEHPGDELSPRVLPSCQNGNYPKAPKWRHQACQMTALGAKSDPIRFGNHGYLKNDLKTNIHKPATQTYAETFGKTKTKDWQRAKPGMPNSQRGTRSNTWKKQTPNHKNIWLRSSKHTIRNLPQIVKIKSH